MTVEELIEKLKSISEIRPTAVVHICETPTVHGTKVNHIEYDAGTNTVTIYT
jgi:hypothetical protein